MDRSQVSRYDYLVGVDVGKGAHHACVLPAQADDPVDSFSFPTDEASTRDAVLRAAGHGETLLVTDQAGSFGALLCAVCARAGVDVAVLPPKKFRQFATLQREDKSDAIDARILAEAPRAIPGALQAVGQGGAAAGELAALTRQRGQAVRERTVAYNRLHDLLHQLCPGWEARLSGQALHARYALDLLARYGGPRALRRAGSRAVAWAAAQRQGARMAALADELLGHARSMLSAVAGAEIMERRCAALASRIIELDAEIGAFEGCMLGYAGRVPEYALLMTVPGAGPVLAAEVACAIGDVGRFPSEAKLAAYAGIARCRHESGSSLWGTRPRKGGNRRLKAAMCQMARCAAHAGGAAGAYHARKMAEGKSAAQATHAVARKMVGIIYAMLSSGQPYDPQRHARVA